MLYCQKFHCYVYRVNYSCITYDSISITDAYRVSSIAYTWLIVALFTFTVLMSSGIMLLINYICSSIGP